MLTFSERPSTVQNDVITQLKKKRLKRQKGVLNIPLWIDAHQALTLV